MEPKKLLLMGAMLLVAVFVFLNVRKLATPKVIEVPAAQTTAAPVEKVKYTKILAATGEVAYGTRLTVDNFKWIDWPSEVVSPDFISQADRPEAITELDGTASRSIIFENEPITERKLVKPGDRGLMAALLTPGMRAVTTRISVDTAAGGFIQPGDRVDIILTFLIVRDPNLPIQRTQEYAADTIFENVRVMAIDQVLNTNAETGASVIGSTATFEMSQEDAEALQRAVAKGDISLTLRPIGSGGMASGRSHARAQKETKGHVGSLSVYRAGQATQVAIQGH